MNEEIEDPTDIRYYGGDMTIHDTESVDVEVDENGKVVAVWFRCQPLPFKQSNPDKRRAKEMVQMYNNNTLPSIDAVVLRETRQ